VITTHVLDTSRGRPASGVPVVLEIQRSGWEVLGKGATDADGRLKDLLPDNFALAAGVYRLTFDASAYFPDGFYPSIMIVFTVRDPSRHYHIPVLLSPYGYTTYRGS